MGHARKKPEPDREEAKVLPALQALSLLSGRLSDSDEDDSGRGDDTAPDDLRGVERPRTDRAAPET